MPLKDKRILVVEDEFLLARDLTIALEQAGAVVIGPTPSVDRALRRLRHEVPDAAVLDINLRGDDVSGLAEELKARAIPFVFATAYQDHDVARLHPDVPCLMKPVDLQKLIQALEDVTGATSTNA